MTKPLTLILMRHAKSDWSDPTLPDHDRPLNKRGKRSAQALGDWMRETGHLPGQALVSSATRTMETFDRLGLALTPQADERLYHAEPEQMLALLQDATAQSVLMVGHNPGIADLAGRLIDNPPDHPRFIDYPTGATLVLNFDVESWDQVDWEMGQAMAFVIPRELLGA